MECWIELLYELICFVVLPSSLVVRNNTRGVVKYSVGCVDYRQSVHGLVDTYTVLVKKQLIMKL